MTMTAVATLITLLAAAGQTDTTLKVQHGTRLNVTNFGGVIAVQGWGKNAVRIAATHSQRVRVMIEETGPNIAVQAMSHRGLPARVDYQISAPAWMALTLSGVYGDISVQGSRGEISAETVKGEVSIIGGIGFIKATSVEGAVRVRGARGRLELSSVNDGVTVNDVEGEVNVEAVNGDVVLQGVRSGRVEVGTVNGDVIYLGSIERGGRYRFASHNGDVEVAIPDPANATISIATFNGEFESDFPVELTETKRGKRFGFTLGKGSALVELETFGGTTKLRRTRNLKVKEE